MALTRRQTHHHVFTNLVLQVKLFVVVTFFARAIASNRRNVEHATTEFDKGAAFDGNVHVRQVFHGPIDNALDIVFAKELGNGLHFKNLTILVRDKAVLRKVVRKEIDNPVAKLFFLFGKIRAADNANRDLFAQRLHKSHHVGRNGAARDGESSIYIKQSEDTRVRRSHGEEGMCWNWKSLQTNNMTGCDL